MHADVAQASKALSENGRHFLRSTLEEIHKDTPAGNRNAVIFVAAGLEVLLKTRLALEHWTLLFDDPANAKISEVKNADFVSVQASKLVARLNNVASLKIDSEIPASIFKLRNRVVHFAPPTGIAIRVDVAKALNFALQFIHDHMLPNLHNNEHDELTKMKEEISKVFQDLDDFRINRLNDLSGALSTQGIVVRCPDCTQDTLSLKSDDETDTCLFCLAKNDGILLAERYVSEVLHWSWRDLEDGEDDPIQDCIECSSLSFVTGVHVARRPEVIHACFSCAAVYKAKEVQRCSYCAKWMAVSAGDDSCYDCLKETERRLEDSHIFVTEQAF